MDHHDHVNLLRLANLLPGSYADFGAGSGAFTLALRELVGPESIIYAVDKKRSSLKALEQAHRARFNSISNLFLCVKDFSSALDIPPLNGLVMANSLHFFRDKIKILRHAGTFLKPDGLLLIVEYNVDSGNLWVPHPFSFNTYQQLAPQAGYIEPRLLAKTPSSFLREFYSAMTRKKE